MISFGFITEGITDQIVIENILNGYFNTKDIDVNELQPMLDETDKSRVSGYGGWKLVFDYCESTKFKEAFQYNDYIIIQVDTDVSEEKHYDISQFNEKGKELTPLELIEKVIQKFRFIIGENFFDKNRNKIIFAISVHSLECWLLPIYYNDNKRSKIKNCLDTLNQKLCKKEGFTIDSENKNYNENYDRISKYYRKHKNLMKCYEKNPSLKFFIEEIRKKDIIFEEEYDF